MGWHRYGHPMGISLPPNCHHIAIPLPSSFLRSSPAASRLPLLASNRSSSRAMLASFTTAPIGQHKCARVQSRTLPCNSELCDALLRRRKPVLHNGSLTAMRMACAGSRRMSCTLGRDRNLSMWHVFSKAPSTTKLRVAAQNFLNKASSSTPSTAQKACMTFSTSRDVLSP